MSLRTVRASHAVRAAARAGDAGLGRVPIAAPAARVQARNGGAVYVAQGTLVFVGVAISDTRTYVRPLGLAHGGRGGGGRPAVDRGGVRRVAAAQCT